MNFFVLSIVFSAILATNTSFSMQSPDQKIIEKSISAQSFHSDGEGWLVSTDTCTIPLHNNDGLQLQNPTECKETEYQESYTANHDSPPVTQSDIKKKDRTSIFGEDSACSTTSSVSDNLNTMHEHQKIRSLIQSPRASSEYLDKVNSIITAQPTHTSSPIERNRSYSSPKTPKNNSIIAILTKALGAGLTSIDTWFDTNFPDIKNDFESPRNQNDDQED